MANAEVTYNDAEGTTFKGYIAYSEPNNQKKPAVIIAHAWDGLSDFSRQKAHDLAQLGYVAFAADMYGEGKTAESFEERVALMKPLFLDRKFLQSRINAALEKLKEYDFVDSSKIGAIGFCFGGLTVIELVRSGAPIRGAVSFHGVLGNKLGEEQAKTVAIAKDIKSSLLICHGHDDPMVSEEDIQRLLKDLTVANVDWQMHTYGHAQHAFTNPKANDPKLGTVYNQLADKRSWRLMVDFFEEIFQ